MQDKRDYLRAKKAGRQRALIQRLFSQVVEQPGWDPVEESFFSSQHSGYAGNPPMGASATQSISEKTVIFFSKKSI